MLVSEYNAQLEALFDDVSQPQNIGYRLGQAFAAFTAMIELAPGSIPVEEQVRIAQELEDLNAAVLAADAARDSLSTNPADTVPEGRVVKLMDLRLTANRLLREISGYTVRKKPSYGPIILGMGVLAGAVGFAVWASNRRAR